jgi:peptidoglycan/LPS O-acetylase OafA/YrhL
VLVLIPAISAYARHELAGTLPHQGWAWLYAVNFFYLFHPGADFRYLGHFWSLAVEEHFYLLWPVLVRALSPRNLGLACVLAALLSCLARVAAPYAGIDAVAMTMVTPFRVDTLCLGALLGVWRFERRSPRLIVAAAVITAAAALVASVLTLFIQRLAPTLTELARGLRGAGTHGLLWAAFAGLVVSPPASIPQRLFSSRVLRFFGKYSYGLYVIHAIVGLAVFRARLIERLAPRVGSFSVALVIADIGIVILSILIAIASYRFLESPFLALKDRFAPRDTSSTLESTTDPKPAVSPKPVSA